MAVNSDPVAFNSDLVAFNSDLVAFNSDLVAFTNDPVAFNSDLVAFNSDLVAFNSDQLAVNSDPVAFDGLRLDCCGLKRGLFYGAIGGVLLVLLKLIEYQYLVRAYPAEVYGGLVAVIFMGVGIYAGLRLTRPKVVEVEVVREVVVRAPFTLNAEKLKELGITQREHEILGLIAEGLSNREIAERLFVSENTVKTHSSRLFEKMSVSRRTQAVQKGKELGLIP